MAKAKKPVGRPPAIEESEQRTTVVNLKGSTEYAAWLEGLRKKTYISKVQIVRLALQEWAAKHGHDAPPEL